VPDSEAQKLYEAADVYVLPSVSEPFGISVLEAMTSGCPTIVSKTTGVGEALTHVLRAEHWDSDEIADQILSVLHNKPLREALGKNGALEVRKFTWERCGRRTLDAYRLALARAHALRAVAA
jgi:glycosyltransferase involved in cell wall biosynthesis